MATTALPPSAAHSFSISWIAISFAFRSSCSYAAERPPTMSRMLANRSLKMFAPRIASPLTMPSVSAISRPGTFGVVTTSISSLLNAMPQHHAAAREYSGPSAAGNDLDLATEHAAACRFEPQVRPHRLAAVRAYAIGHRLRFAGLRPPAPYRAAAQVRLDNARSTTALR